MSFTFTDPMQKFLSEGNPPFHASLVFCSSMPQTVIESFFQARDHLPFFKNFTVDMEQMVFLMMEEAAPKAQENYTEVRNAVLRLGEMHNIPEAAHRAIAANPKREPGSGRKLKIRNLANAGVQFTCLFASDIVKGSFYLDCSSLNVKNIYEAALLCDHILRLKDMNVIGLSSVVKSSLAHIKKIIDPAGRNAKIQASGRAKKTFAGEGAASKETIFK
jgi:hypothetical protein